MLACPELFREPLRLALAPVVQCDVATGHNPSPRGGEPALPARTAPPVAPRDAVQCARSAWSTSIRRRLLSLGVPHAARVACVLVAAQFDMVRLQRRNEPFVGSEETVAERMARLEQLEVYPALWDLLLLALTRGV